MSDATAIKRHDGPLYELEAGRYAVDGTKLSTRCVFVSCPKCGGISRDGDGPAG